MCPRIGACCSASGINLGDVLIEGDDILGDGVNVAARLEGITEPGGICISEDAYRQVRGKLDAAFEDAGEQQLKNITRPVRVYRVRFDTTEKSSPALPLPTTTEGLHRRKMTRCASHRHSPSRRPYWTNMPTGPGSANTGHASRTAALHATGLD
jgi:hypothetical protein